MSAALHPDSGPVATPGQSVVTGESGHDDLVNVVEFSGAVDRATQVPTEHRKFSGDGKRRISLEILERNPHWASIGTTPYEPDRSGVIGGFRFDVRADEVVVGWPGGSLRTPRHFFTRGLAALVAYEMHLEHNEFDGGLVVHDLGDRVTLKAGGYSETLAGSTVLAGFAGLLERCR